MAAKSTKGMSASSYRSVGKTHDGVTILAPATKAKHFSAAQIRSTIKEVMRHSASGQLTPKASKISTKRAPKSA